MRRMSCGVRGRNCSADAYTERKESVKGELKKTPQHTTRMRGNHDECGVIDEY
jgi:hypothetical protein